MSIYHPIYIATTAKIKGKFIFAVVAIQFCYSFITLKCTCSLLLLVMVIMYKPAGYLLKSILPSPFITCRCSTARITYGICLYLVGLEFEVMPYYSFIKRAV